MKLYNTKLFVLLGVTAGLWQQTYADAAMMALRLANELSSFKGSSSASTSSDEFEPAHYGPASHASSYSDDDFEYFKQEAMQRASKMWNVFLGNAEVEGKVGFNKNWAERFLEIVDQADIDSDDPAVSIVRKGLQENKFSKDAYMTLKQLQAALAQQPSASVARPSQAPKTEKPKATATSSTGSKIMPPASATPPPKFDHASLMEEIRKGKSLNKTEGLASQKTNKKNAVQQMLDKRKAADQDTWDEDETSAAAPAKKPVLKPVKVAADSDDDW